ncbi:hypothetical protein [Zavarzinella formosa]|uniref:hypothetical protein n=1 Tax=Zavarzinella formosa TaxID=360055 RepID=UPI00037CB62E|nr:hypothetical protein [Zavarzinella formosa]
MTVYISIWKNKSIYVITPLTVPPGAKHAPRRPKVIDLVRPGESLHGHTFDELAAIGNGKHDLTPKSIPAVSAGAHEFDSAAE